MTVYDAAIDYAYSDNVVDAYGHDSFLRGAAWQKEQDATELAAIREKARGFLAEKRTAMPQMDRAYQVTNDLWDWISELAGEDNG